MTFFKFFDGIMHEVTLNLMVDTNSHHRLMVWLTGEMINCRSGEVVPFKYKLDFQAESLIHIFHDTPLVQFQIVANPEVPVKEQFQIALHYSTVLEWPNGEIHSSKQDIKVY